ncbi:hypothetical protein HHK36_008829 [Tetracentron sinense]|uniref:Uncharacterized protein n=1 Tax=Tetracentron sinense TaxID=13715 RepID=A0A834ZHH7_TETSI|nr:hypothetical protein HHK36_008829 [Tetracentron sinense]
METNFARSISGDAPETRRKNVSFPARIWVSVERVVVRVMRGRRRLVSLVLQLKKRRALGISRVKSRKHVNQKYDLLSYSKNFDDGRWQQEEVDFYTTRSFAHRIQPFSSPASSWAFPRSKSMPSLGEFSGGSIRKWWDWGWAWILSRKPTFARDLEMNEEESAMLGCHNKGSWRHVFYKVRSDLRRLVRSDHVGLPQTFRYDSYSYSQNFDDGKRSEG